MSYAGRVAGTTERPSCWGNEQAYEPDDDECEECRFQHTCRAEVLRKGGGDSTRSGYVPIRTTTPEPPRPTNYGNSYGSTYRERPVTPVAVKPRRTDFAQEGGLWEPGLTREDENPITRVLKDMAMGGIGGSSFELWRFAKVFRIK